jgi:hypothetical protein
MDLPKHLQQLLPICDEMGVSLYQRFSESDASSFLNIPIQSLQLIRGQNKISYLELNESQIE